MAFEKSFLDVLRYQAAQSHLDVDAFNKVIYEDVLPCEVPSPAHTFIFSGPPVASYAMQNPHLLTPIGLVQDVQYGFQRPMAPLPELGNKYQRFAGGRWNHSVNLSRVMSMQANIIGMLYAWVIKGDGFVQSFIVHPSGEQASNLQMVTVDSEITNIPFGLYKVKTTEDGRPVSAVFWERAMIAGGSEAEQAGQAYIMESLQLVFSRSVPVPTILATPGNSTTTAEAPAPNPSTLPPPPDQLTSSAGAPTLP